MTSLTDTQVVTASGGLVELGYGQVTSNVTVSSTTETAGDTVIPAVTVVSDGSPLDIEFSSARARVTGHPSGNYIVFNVVVDGTTQGRLGVVYSTGSTSLDVPVHLKYRTTLSAGSHTIAVTAWRYNANVTIQATGTASGDELPTFLRVSKIVQATQWPAVTTGTIICTSSTRPASPFEGQKIYETDTDRELTYDSSAWVQTNSLGGWSTWTPQLYQNGNLTSTTPHARYTRIGDTAIVQAKVSATAAGTTHARWPVDGARAPPMGERGTESIEPVGV